MFSVYFISAIMAGISNGGYLGPIQDGIKTAFETVDTIDNNNCEWEKSRPVLNTNQFPFGNFVAVDTEIFDESVTCGECYEIKCVDKIDSWGGCSCKHGATATVMVMDFGHDVYSYDGQVFDARLDVANQLFQPDNCLGDSSKMKITYQQVCCNHEDNIKIYNLEGTDAHHLFFTVAEVRGYGSITNFYMREPGRSLWYECSREPSPNLNNYWVCDPWTLYEPYRQEGEDDNLGPFVHDPPYQTGIDIKITDSNGNTIESLGLITNFNPEAEFDFGSNFAYSECGDASTTTTPEPTTTTTTREPTTTTTTPEPTTTTTTPEPTTTTTTREPTTTTTTREPTTTTTTPEPTTTTTTREPTTTTTTREPTTTTTASTTEECMNSPMLNEPCKHDNECPRPCMRCCKGRHVCEFEPSYQAAAVAALQHEMNEGVSDVLHKPKDKSDPNMFGYIALIGVIAFILINNLFIGCWCLSKSKNRSNGSGKYDMVSENDIE